MAKTREEIDALFEEYHDELLAWRKLYEGEQEREQEAKKVLRMQKFTKETGITGELAGILSSFSDIERSVEITDQYIGGLGTRYEIIDIEMKQAQLRATLLLAAQVKRVADQLEENENNRIGEDEVRSVRANYQGL